MNFLLSLLVVSQEETSNSFLCFHCQEVEEHSSLVAHKSQQEVISSSSIVFRNLFEW